MRQKVPRLEPANDNPKPEGQGDLFVDPREIAVGPISIGERIPHLSRHVDGAAVAREIIRRGDGPEAAA